MRCRDAERWLLEAPDGALPVERAESLRSHLERCPACRQLQADTEAALSALERAIAPAPDLWPALQRRLAAGVPCPQAEEWLPASLDGELPPSREIALRMHLRACASCAAEADRLEHSLRALRRAAACGPKIDLWPAVAARLEAGRERGSANGTQDGPLALPRRARPALAFLQGQRLLQPALALATALCIAAIAHLSVRSPSMEQGEPPLGYHRPLAAGGRAAGGPAKGERRTAKETRHPARRAVLGLRPSRLAPRTSRPDTTGRRRVAARRNRAVRTVVELARLDRRHRPDGGARTGLRMPAGGEGTRLMIARLPDAAPSSPVAMSPGTEANSRVAESVVTPELVRVARLLAEMEEAIARPFDAEPDAR